MLTMVFIFTLFIIIIVDFHCVFKICERYCVENWDYKVIEKSNFEYCWISIYKYIVISIYAVQNFTNNKCKKINIKTLDLSLHLKYYYQW